jgi:shikimate dehydrogenase
VLGDNTDGVGLVRDLTVNLGWVIADRRVLVLGAGGAARGVLAPLLAAQPAQLLIANRTVDKADHLAQECADLGRVAGGGFADLAGVEPFDLVINATSASLAGALPPLPEHLLAPGANAYDMMYGAELTRFLCWAQGYGAAAVADGLGMLVEQAAEAFFIWRGVRPETRPVIAQVRYELVARNPHKGG